MENITANLSGSISTYRTTLGGVEYLVAPLTLIVPGVLHGSKGPLYYPAEEVANSANDWNGMPMVVYHPKWNGVDVSARDPYVAEKYEVGRVYHCHFNNKNKLVGEGWFNLEQLTRIDNRVLEMLENSEPIELSTGLFLDTEPAPFGATYNGKAYSFITKNYKPDHLAILPDEVGACSLEDGCGVLVNKSFDQAGSRWEVIDNALQDVGNSSFVNNPAGKWTPPNAGKGAPAEIKRILKTVYSAYRDKNPAEDADVKAKGARIAWGAVRKAGWIKDKNGKWIKKKKSSVKNLEFETDESSPRCTCRSNTDGVNMSNSLATNYDTSYDEMRNELSRQLVERFGYDCWITEMYDGYVIYNRNGECYKIEYTESNGEVSISDSTPTEVERITIYEPVENSRVNSKGDNMALNQKQRESIINDLTTNCECWSDEDDVEVLNGFSDEKLVQLYNNFHHSKQAISIANAAVSGFTDGNNQFRINPQTGKWERGQSNQTQPTTVGNAKKPKKAVMDQHMEDVEGQDPAERDSANKKRMSGKTGAAGTEAYNQNQPSQSQPEFKKPRTADDWFRMAPPEVQNQHRYAQQIVEREKDKVIAELLVNVSDSEKAVQRERLQRRDLEDLYGDLALVPKQPKAEDFDRIQQAKANNSKPRREQGEDILHVPNIDWSEVDANPHERSRQQANTIVNSDVADSLNADGMTDEDYIRSLPPHLREQFQSALQVTDRERMKIVDQLTANLSDEDEIKKMRQKLQRKSINELQDMLALVGNRSSDVTRPNFFGASVPIPATRQFPTVNSNEDLLPLPTVDWRETNGRVK